MCGVSPYWCIDSVTSPRSQRTKRREPRIQGLESSLGCSSSVASSRGDRLVTWLRRLLAWLWRLFRAPRRLERRTVRHGMAQLDAPREVIAPEGGPLKPHHRRRVLHDPRYLPKPNRKNPWQKPSRVLDAQQAARRFARTLRTRRRDHSTLVADQAQLDRLGLPLWKAEGDIAAALGVPVATLRHFSIHRQRELRPHYVTFSVPKPSGGQRIIVAPKRKLKQLQRKLVQILVDKLPVHDAAHGFRRGRSVRTHAEPHVGRAVVVRIDLADFFGTVTFPRVRGLLLALGYGYEVATVLAVLMTEAPRQPVAVEGIVYHVPAGPRHCVQGAPTSPGLCNAIVHKLDRRLIGLASRLGFTYTRYADDLTFSSDEPAAVGRLLHSVRQIVRDEGFRVNTAKTRVLHRGGHQRVCGVTVNDTLGLSRRTRRQLRALIHATEQRRELGEVDPAADARIEGWLAYLAMLNPGQAAALRAGFRG